MFKLPYDCAYFTCQQDYAQNPSNQASAVHELRTSRDIIWVLKRQRGQRSNCQNSLDHGESKGVPEKHLLLLIEYVKAFNYVITTNLKILIEMGVPDHFTCLLRNLYVCEEATVRTRNGKTDWLKFGKGVQQSFILSSCLFNLHAEYIM